MTGPVRVIKRPIEIQAYRYDGTNGAAIVRWAGSEAYESFRGELVVRTLEGDHVAQKGDWVMRGVLGEFYPMRPTVFDASYDELGPA